MLGLSAFSQMGEGVVHEKVFEWFTAGGLHVDLGLSVDCLSGSLVLVITGVGFLIHLYSRRLHGCRTGLLRATSPT